MENSNCNRQYMTTNHIQIGQYPPVNLDGLAMVCFTDSPDVALTLGFLKRSPSSFSSRERKATVAEIKDAARKLGISV